MKKVKYPNLDDYDLSCYEELKGDILYRINGGAEIENSVEAQAQAHEGDTVTRNDGTTHTLTKGDITWAQNQVSNNGGGSSGGSANVSAGNETAIAGGDVSAGTGNPSGQGNAGSGGSQRSSGAGSPSPSSSSSQRSTSREVFIDTRKGSELGEGWYGNSVTNLVRLANGGGKDTIVSSTYEIDHERGVIRASVIDAKNFREAADKFMSYDMEGYGYSFEVYNENGGYEVYSKYSDFAKEKKYQQPDANVFLGYDNSGDTFNQNKTEKELFLEFKQDFNSSEFSATHLKGGGIHLSSELNNSPVTKHVAGSLTFNLMEAECDIGIRKESFGFKLSGGVSVASLSGEIGAQGEDWKFTIGSSLGMGVSGGVEFDWPEKRLSIDATAFLGFSVVIDLPDNIVEWGK